MTKKGSGGFRVAPQIPQHEISCYVTTKYLKCAELEIDKIEKIFDFARMYEQLGGEELSYVDVGKSFDVAVSLLPDLGKIEIVNVNSQ